MKAWLVFAAASFWLAVTSSSRADTPAPDRPRLLVLTDFFKDPDDKQSLIRLLTYANEFEIEGLIATSLAFGTGEVRPELIKGVIDDYAKVFPNLREHGRPGYEYPAPDSLKALVKAGAPVIRTWVGQQKGFPVPHPPGARDSRTCDPAEKWIGEGHDTEASEHIIRVADRDDPRPLWVGVWGGAMDLAQALWKVRHTRSAEETARFVKRLRVYQVSWQDTGIVWIWNNFPDLFLIQTTWLYAGLFKEGDASLQDESWVRANLLEGHGPLGAAYPPANAHGKTAINVKEGDSCTFFHLLAPGLSDHEHPEWGGWGGRFQPFSNATRFYVDGSDRHPSADDPVRQRQWTLGRWNEARANEFAARMDWCVRTVAEANHPPVVCVEGDVSRRILERRVVSGNHVSLSAEDTTDPDGNVLDYHWWHYAEPGSFPGSLELQGQHTPRVNFAAPVVTEPQTIHLVLSVTDRGKPRLTSYRRVVVTTATQ